MLVNIGGYEVAVMATGTIYGISGRMQEKGTEEKKKKRNLLFFKMK